MTEPQKNGLLAVGEQTAAPAPPWCDRLGAEFVVNVIFTTWHGTHAALQKATQWAHCLGAQIMLWCPQIVPRQFSLTDPPISTDFTEQRLRFLVMEFCADQEIAVRVCLCRDVEQCLLHVLDLDSVVLLGGKKRWLRTPEQKLATLLYSHGHRVLFIPTKESVPATAAASERTRN
jgi:hypothetical protein